MIDFDEVAELKAQAKVERRLAFNTQLDPRDPAYIDFDDFFPAQEKQMNHPAIGQQFPEQGGVFAGLMRGRDGAPDYCLIVGPELTPANWGDAVSAALDLVIDGHADFTLPFRAEQALLFANVPELFEEDWYWSNEEHASLPVYAWMQGFGNGYQGSDHKSSQGRARAIRRLKISKTEA